jgi:hypothetical protein
MYRNFGLVWRFSHPLLGEDVGQINPQCCKNRRTAYIHSTDLAEDGRKESKIFRQLSGPPGHTPPLTSGQTCECNKISHSAFQHYYVHRNEDAAGFENFGGLLDDVTETLLTS